MKSMMLVVDWEEKLFGLYIEVEEGYHFLT